MTVFFFFLSGNMDGGREEWEENLDEDFQEVLVREYASIVASY